MQLVQLENVRRYFPVRRAFGATDPSRVVHAVDGVSLDIAPRKTMSLVGESGCGKTTTTRLILRLEKPTAGRVLFRGRDLSVLSRPEMREYRASVQAVFQDPWSSLDPRMRIRDIVGEPLVVNRRLTQQELKDCVARALEVVGLDANVAGLYPHEFSGGQRQRIALARALTLNPALVVLDEPVSSLDVSIGAQVLNLLKDLQRRYDTAYLLVAHNLATVRYLSDRVAVMYLGQIVETGEAERIFSAAAHPYTQALLSAAARSAPGKVQPILLRGDPPSPTDPPSGCRFRTRCPFAFDRCASEVPQLREIAPGQWAACHLY